MLKHLTGILGYNKRMAISGAFFLFHLKVGTRISLRLLAPFLAVIFASTFILGPLFVTEMAALLLRKGTVFEVGAVVTLVLYAFSRIASARVWRGANGWLRHLPVEGRLLHRMAVLAVFLAEIPVLIVTGFLAGTVLWDLPSRMLALETGLLLSAWGAAFLAVSKKGNSLAKISALTTCLIAPSGSWPLTAAAGALLFLSDFLTRPLGKRPRKYRLSSPFKGGGVNLLVTWRAVGWRMIPSVLGAAMVPAGALFFIRNNGMEGSKAKVAVVFGAVFFAWVLLGFLAATVEKRRPTWGWIRSLPWQSGERILWDAGFFLVFGLAMLAIAAVITGRPFIWAGPVLPLIAFRAAGYIRTESQPPWGTFWRMAAEGFFTALGASLFPVLLWFLPVLAVPAFISARNKEKTLKVGRWDELRNLEGGDPLSWSPS